MIYLGIWLIGFSLWMGLSMSMNKRVGIPTLIASLFWPVLLVFCIATAFVLTMRDYKEKS